MKRICVIVALVAIGSFIGIVWWHSTQKPNQPYHTSMYYFDNKDFFSQSIQTFKNSKPLSLPPRVFIVNQHILAAYLIAKQFALAKDPTVKTVVMITQNNWNAGKGSIITSLYPWKTPLGNIAPNTLLAQKLIADHITVQDESIFTEEHGITGIVPYIAASFPQASIVPLVIRDGTSQYQTTQLVNVLSSLDLKSTVIVGSIDMSHYLPKAIADLHDAVTIQTIEEHDKDTLQNLDIDTVPTLRTMLDLSEKVGLPTFVVSGHTNSADIVGDPTLKSTTSYIDGYFTADPRVDTAHETHVLITGPEFNMTKDNERLFLGNHAVISLSAVSTLQAGYILVQDKKMLIPPEAKILFSHLGDHVLHIVWKGSEVDFLVLDENSAIINTKSFSIN